MSAVQSEPKRRGRPPKVARDYQDTRQELIRSGLAIITECGFVSAGIEPIVKQIGVPKGSFYHYFASKEEFGHAVLEAYGVYFAGKLARHLEQPDAAPLARMGEFVEDACRGMARFAFRRGCLVGNLMQEVPQLSQALGEHLLAILEEWEARLAACLDEAIKAGELPADTDIKQAAHHFWSGWEGAVMRAKLQQSAQPMTDYWLSYRRALSLGVFSRD